MIVPGTAESRRYAVSRKRALFSIDRKCSEILRFVQDHALFAFD